MNRAIVLRAHGDPANLLVEARPNPSPGPRQVVVRNVAIGVNYHDLYVRSGLYRTFELPGVLGLEGAGLIQTAGAEVANLAVGDRVAYLNPGYGAYQDQHVLPEDMVIRLPDEIGFETAAGTLLKGITAGILLKKVHLLEQGAVILVQAAAGGVGHILAQWAAHLGAREVGTVGSQEKARLARNYGCHDIILYEEEDVPSRVFEITAGRGVDVVYDAVGAATFQGSLASLAIRGHLISYGQSSGPVPPFDLSRLASKSASITRAGYSHYVPTAASRQAAADAFFQLVLGGAISPRTPRLFALEEAAEAHRWLERRELGPVVLVT